MITCPSCGKENQDHYKFCLSCGASLQAVAAGGGVVAPELLPPPPPPGPRFGGAAAVSSPQLANEADRACMSCGSAVPASFRFCGACGHPMGSAAPRDAPETRGPRRGRLMMIQPDGSEGDGVPLHDVTVVGRDAGYPFESDTYLSPQHAVFSFHGNTLNVEDLTSLNGVYLRIAPDQPFRLIDGTVFRIGQEIIRFELIPAPVPDGHGLEVMGSPNPDYLGRIALVIGRDALGNAYCVPREGLHLGRERGDIIFPDDGYVSGLHCRIHGDKAAVFVTDVGSSNGTFVRVRGQGAVPRGSMILLGQQLFRADF